MGLKIERARGRRSPQGQIRGRPSPIVSAAYAPISRFALCSLHNSTVTIESCTRRSGHRQIAPLCLGDRGTTVAAAAVTAAAVTARHGGDKCRAPVTVYRHHLQ